MKKHYYLLITFIIAEATNLVANPIISLFFNSQPDPIKITENLKKPGKIAKHIVHGITQHNHISGICATYSGYIAASDNNGEIRFPRKHKADNAHILITTEMTPIFLFENTIDHWELVPGKAAKSYLLNQIYDESSKQHVWKTTEQPLPLDNKISSATIVIIAKPTNIVIPSEIHTIIKSANLVLPPIYVKKGTNFVSNSAYILNIRHLFRPVETKNKVSPLQLTSQLHE